MSEPSRLFLDTFQQALDAAELRGQRKVIMELGAPSQSAHHLARLLEIDKLLEATKKNHVVAAHPPNLWDLFFK